MVEFRGDETASKDYLDVLSIKRPDPPYLSEMFTHKTSFQNYGLRSSKMNLELPKCRTNYYKNSFAFSGAKLWNDLLPSVKDESSLKRFVCKLDSYPTGTRNASK